MTLQRPHEISRLEAFSDAVFGFALMLLVGSLEVPRTCQDLMRLVRGFVPFGRIFMIYGAGYAAVFSGRERA